MSAMGGGGGNQPARPDDPNAYQSYLPPNVQGPLPPAGGVSLRNRMMGGMRSIHDSPQFQRGVGAMSDAFSSYGKRYQAPGDRLRHQGFASSLREPPDPYQYNPAQFGEDVANGAGSLLKYLPMLFK